MEQPRSGLNLDEIKGNIKFLRGKTDISDFTEEEISKGHNSVSYLITLHTNDQPTKKIIAKKFIRTPDESLVYKLTHEPYNSYLREKENYERIHKISKDLPPKLYGSIDEKLVLFLECLETPTQKTKLIEVTNKIRKDPENEELKKEKSNLLLEGLKYVAQFNGLCNANKEQFPEEQFDYSRSLDAETKLGIKKELLTDYLTRIIAFRNEDSQYNQEKIIKELEKNKGINLEKRIGEILGKKQPSLEGELILQHGDCGVHNIFEGGKFIDLEDFGYHAPTKDIVSFFLGTDDISTPDGKDIPRFLTYYLAYYLAYKTSPNGQDLENEIKKLGSKSPQEKTQYILKEKKIPLNKYANFVFSFFSNTIEESLHLDATYKRYSLDYLNTLLCGLDDYTIKELQTCRINYINEVFSTLTQICWLTFHCDDNSSVRDHFYLWGKLLNDIGLTKINEGTLDDINKGRTISDEFYSLLEPTIKENSNQNK